MSPIGIIRVAAGILSLPAFFLLFQFTEDTAKVQQSGPQILQVYTRSAFYGIMLVGVLFAIYVATRWRD